MTTKTICPHCNKVNEFANEPGAVWGPREYHADCWEVAEAKVNAQDAVDEINSYEGNDVWGDLILGLNGYDDDASSKLDPYGRSMSAVVSGWVIRIDEDDRDRGWYVDCQTQYA